MSSVDGSPEQRAEASPAISSLNLTVISSSSSSTASSIAATSVLPASMASGSWPRKSLTSFLTPDR